VSGLERAGAGADTARSELDVLPPAARDVASVGADGAALIPIDGVRLVRLAPFVDHRGAMVEVVNFDEPFWQEPIVHAYQITIRPGRIKGWGMHRLQADRYFSGHGLVRVVLHDGRVESPTHGLFAEFHFSEEAPGLLYIPPGVWHADQNTGDRQALIVNFPTRAYDRANPDKYRIDPHSGAIKFDWTLRDG
jgi:dTDP-4-dehydrorhamnose 3,5-epimerase